MAKKRGRPKTSARKDVPVKLDAEIVTRAKLVVLARGLSLAEYLSDLLRTPVERDYFKELRRLQSEEGQK